MLETLNEISGMEKEERITVIAHKTKPSRFYRKNRT